MVVCLVAVAMIAVSFIPRASTTKCGQREETIRFLLDALKITLDTAMSAILSASFESMFREG